MDASAGMYVLRAMKAERLNALLDDAVWEQELLMRVPPEIFQLVLRYILGADVDNAAFEARIRKIPDPELRNKAMSLAQVYRQEGHQEGRQEGRREGRQEGRREGRQEGLAALR